ncbi:MAG: hypothetical protein HOO97_01655 [Sideroxydans sp.]|nr:hypothetical protein [Sideroxydans sp.]
MMGAASVLTPIQAASLPLNNFSIKADALGADLPRIRMILVGESSLKYLDSLVCDTLSSMPNWRPQDILYLDNSGYLVICPARIERFIPYRVGDDWEISEQAIADHAETASRFQRSESGITQFIRDSDWLLIVAALDNPMAFFASEKIATIARDAGVMSVSVVGTPYLAGLMEADGRWAHSEVLSGATIDVAERMSAICQCTIPDNGFWGQGADSLSWGFYMSESALHMISEMATRIDCCAQIGDAIASSGVCMVGERYATFEHMRPAIEEVLLEYSSSDWWGDMQITSTGAIFQIAGEVDKASLMKDALSQYLSKPSQFLRNGSPFWRDEANFYIVTSTSGYLHDADDCLIRIFSTGVAPI